MQVSGSQDSLRGRVTQLALRLGMLKGGIAYVTDNSGWVIDREGQYLMRYARQFFSHRSCHMTSSYRGLRSQLLHFGSLWSYVSGGYACHPSNRVVVTVFHGDDRSDNPTMRAGIQTFQQHLDRAEFVVTASSIMGERLVRWGVRNERFRRIPLSVDLDIFTVRSEKERSILRERVGIPPDTICVGSFQKDGNGWGEGLEPKLIKGPDLFVEAVRRLALQHPIFVLLTGPARGYVKQRLAQCGIPYHHAYLNDYSKLPTYYACLDVYLITSREEGGPKALPECMATGVPLVTTRVGMAPDMIQHGVNGFMVETGDIDGLVDCATMLIQRPDLRQSFIENSLQSVKAYDWRHVARRYCEEIYAPLSGSPIEACLLGS